MKTKHVLLLALAIASQALAQTAVSARFKRFDKNGDGKITADELGMPAVFKAADKNGDGAISPEEFTTYLNTRRGGRGSRSQKASPTAESVKETEIRYAETPGVEANSQSLDIYAPKDAKNLPVMIYIHGGGWRTGDKRSIHGKPAYFTGRGFVFVSLNYRLVPAVDILTQLQDSANAIGWVKKNIAKHGGDPTRLHLIGHSAGAHHVAILATNERFLREAGVAFGDLESVVELDTQALDVPELMGDNTNELYLQAFGNNPAVWKQVSPRDNVAKAKDIPPFFLVVANERAPKLAQAVAFQKSLQAAGVRCEFVEAPQHDHGSLNRAIGDRADEVTEAMVKFHDSILGRKTSAAATAKLDDAFVWRPSLTFDAEKTSEGPLPVNAMQLVTHRGMLFCGMATSFERDRYSGGRSYIYSKASADAPWQIEADFGPGTSRIGQMFSARFEQDENGNLIAGGPQELLVAFTMNLARRGREAIPLQMRVRDDATGQWHTHDLPTPRIVGSNVRELWLHRDRVSGADLIFVAASPSPCGIYAGVFDPDAPGRIRWRSEPEITAQGRRGTSKWFGMAAVNGVLLASDLDAVYRRDDGPQPGWSKVLQFPRGVGDEGGAAVRGLTAVPNPQAVTGWSEQEMLLLATQFRIWRMRVPESTAEQHEHTAELDLVPWFGEQTGEPIIFAESAFNRLTPFRASSDAAPAWPIGFQVVYPVPGKKLSNRDPGSYRLKDDAWFLLRDESAHYTLHRIESDRRLFLARDFKPSPFPQEPHTLYACGYNGSYFKGSLGTAWVFRGTPKGKEP